MKRKGRDNPNFSHGAFAGANWNEFRYGPKNQAISLAPVFRGDRKKDVINKAMDVLRDWRSSPFEFEASTRHGIRQGLCIEGYGWARSDRQAEEVVTEALRGLGAKRPTWSQGQPWYSEHENVRSTCFHCRRPIPDRQYEGAKAVFFCSDECREFSAQRARDKVARRVSLAEHRARLAAQTAKTRDQKRRPCEACGKMFVPAQRGKQAEDIKYCSAFCRATPARVHKPEPCALCGTMFKPRGNKGKVGRFCSIACGAQFREMFQTPKKYEPKTCAFCFHSFEPRGVSGAQQYCSRACSRLAYRSSKIKSGRLELTMEIFDHVFRKDDAPVPAAPKVISLTPQRLDWYIMERGLRITAEVRIAA